jgi:hypothetical protein
METNNKMAIGNSCAKGMDNFSCRQLLKKWLSCPPPSISVGFKPESRWQLNVEFVISDPDNLKIAHFKLHKNFTDFSTGSNPKRGSQMDVEFVFRDPENPYRRNLGPFPWAFENIVTNTIQYSIRMFNI